MDKLIFVSFESTDGKFKGYLSMEDAIGSKEEPEALLCKVTKIYERTLNEMASLIGTIKKSRANHKPTPAQKIWQLGNIIFTLRDELAELGLQLDGVYDHLSRDLGVKRKWLEKVVIFRRYLPDKNLIPESLNWGRCEKGTRRVAERLRLGFPPV